MAKVYTNDQAKRLKIVQRIAEQQQARRRARIRLEAEERRWLREQLSVTDYV